MYASRISRDGVHYAQRIINRHRSFVTIQDQCKAYRRERARFSRVAGTGILRLFQPTIYARIQNLNAYPRTETAVNRNDMSRDSSCPMVSTSPILFHIYTASRRRRAKFPDAPAPLERRTESSSASTMWSSRAVMSRRRGFSNPNLIHSAFDSQDSRSSTIHTEGTGLSAS